MCNQFRFRGYHYPRSQKTKINKKSNKSFERFYGINIFKKTKIFMLLQKTAKQVLLTILIFK